MKVFFEKPATIVSVPVGDSRTFYNTIQRCQRTKDHVRIFGYSKDHCRVWIIPRPGTTPDQLKGVIRQASSEATIETFEGLAVEPSGSTKQIQALAGQVRALASVKTVYALGDIFIWLAVVPEKGFNVSQLQQDIEALAYRIS